MIDEKEKLEKKNDQMNGEEIANKYKLKNKIEEKLKEIDNDLKILSDELNIQKKKKGKYSNIKNKEDIMKKLEEKVQIIKNRYEGVENDNEELIDTFSVWEEKNKNSSQEREERELTDEEKKKIEEWKMKKNEQDGELEEIRKIIKNMKGVAITIGDNINSVEIKTKDLGGEIHVTNKKIETQNERLKELIKKIRPCEKFCCDIILILIFLGLLCVLYSLIKNRYIKK